MHFFTRYTKFSNIFVIWPPPTSNSMTAEKQSQTQQTQ